MCYRPLHVGLPGMGTDATLNDDGRVDIDINEPRAEFSNVFIPALQSQLHLSSSTEGVFQPNESSELGNVDNLIPPLHLNVVIQIVGSRGDVQPFIALGKTLKNQHGHRVRIATHLAFKSFVEESGLEFFSIGGDPAELMAFMVKNPGLLPSFQSLRNGDIGKRRKGIYEVLKGCWRSCIEAGDGTGPRAKTEDYASVNSGNFHQRSGSPFVADVIIANPPSFAHVHCAERLGIPVQIMFTMPWSPTQAFPHPLATIRSSNLGKGFTNFVSYAMVGKMIWHGLGDVINLFRQRCLNLEPISIIWAPGMISRLRIPVTYCWSPALLPKPRDWGPHISVAGFFDLPLASSFQPQSGLLKFLEAGPAPAYIGFGSIVMKDPTAMTLLIFEAIAKAGVRAIVSIGWAGLGAAEVPENVYLLGNVPHAWLFERVSIVVHHGGAGTTAAGLIAGKPTVIVPFFGDQQFWGHTIARSGAGPNPIPYKELTADKLAIAIKQALHSSVIETARAISASIREENGCENGANSFHANLSMARLRCSVLPDHTAVWRVKRSEVRLSALAATILRKEGLLRGRDLKLYRSREYEPEDGPWDPISGGTSALLGTLGHLVMGFVEMPVELLRALKSPELGQRNGNAISAGGGQANAIPSGSKRQRANLFLPSGKSTSALADNEIRTTQKRYRGMLLSSVSKYDPVAKDLAGELCGTYGRKPPRRQTRYHSPTESPRMAFVGAARDVSLDVAFGAGRAATNVVLIGLKMPVNFAVGVARGFHNAPKLYGDTTVRLPSKINDLRSGVKAAGQEFGFGIFDAATGLVTQPLHGAKEAGVTGFLKGMGKGVGGAVLKPGAAIFGLPAYTLKGVYKELHKYHHLDFSTYIMTTRTAQGEKEWQHSTAEDRERVISRWKCLGMKSNKG